MTTAPISAYSSCVMQATALELTVLFCMKPTATWTSTMTKRCGVLRWTVDGTRAAGCPQLSGRRVRWLQHPRRPVRRSTCHTPGRAAAVVWLHSACQRTDSHSWPHSRPRHHHSDYRNPRPARRRHALWPRAGLFQLTAQQTSSSRRVRHPQS